MANTSRKNILTGPARLAFGATAMQAEGNVTVDMVTEYFPVNSSAFGEIGRRVKDRRITVGFAPREFSDLATLFPYATKMPGDRLFPGGASPDVALVITPRNGAPLTIHNAAITALPALTASAEASLLGAMQFTGLVIDGGDPGDLDDLFTFGAVGSGVTMGACDLTKIPNSRYTLTRNAVAMQSAAGFAIAFDLQTAPIKADGDTTVDYEITALGATITFAPWGMTEANWAALLDTTALGDEPTGYDAVIDGRVGKPSITIANTYPPEGGQLAYGAGQNRTPQLVFRATRKITAGALTALWTFGTVPEPEEP